MNLRLNPAVLRFVDAARAFRGCVDRPSTPAEWARQLAQAMAALVAAACDLPDVALPESDVLPEREFEVLPEVWRRHYRDVPALLDAPGFYHMHFEPLAIEGDGTAVFGHLGDDVGDVYRDVIKGLRAWETGCTAYDAEVVWSWRFQFATHWGRHAVHATVALYELAAKAGGLG